MQSATTGVEQLIDRLRAEGVNAGRSESDRILEETRAKAASIVREANAEAQRIRQQTQQEVQQVTQSGESALKTAVRDASIALREEILNRLAHQLRVLVTNAMRDPQFLTSLLKEIAGGLTRDGKTDGVKMILPPSVISVDELRRNPHELMEGSLSRFAAELAQESLSKGMEISVGTSDQVGVRLQLAHGDVNIDVTDDAISTLLLKHLTPRFRALMEGVVTN